MIAPPGEGTVIMTARWQGLVQQVTYGLDLRSPVSDEAVRRVADALVAQRLHTRPVPEYHSAITVALASPGDDGVTRDVLARLLRELDGRRPWPEAPYVQVDAWADLASAPVVGRVPWRRREVGARLNRTFADVEVDGTRARVLVLRLRTGQVVGLRMSADAREPGAAVLTHDDPAATVAALGELTGLTVEPAG